MQCKVEEEHKMPMYQYECDRKGCGKKVDIIFDTYEQSEKEVVICPECKCSMMKSKIQVFNIRGGMKSFYSETFDCVIKDRNHFDELMKKNDCFLT